VGRRTRKEKVVMEFAFIIGVFGVWLIIALAKGADWFGGSGKDYKESDRDFLNRVARENSERARKQLEEIRKNKRDS
jgi:hypothetical protein